MVVVVVVVIDVTNGGVGVLFFTNREGKREKEGGEGGIKSNI